MRRALLCVALCASVPLVAACAELMNAMEQATDENSAEGQLIRGANRLRKSFQDLDPSEEHFIGRSVAAEILAMPEYRLVDDPALSAYVNRVGLAVAETNDAARRTFAGYKFAVLDTDEVNAFACPGGTVLVTRGLIADTRSEDELAGVLAHEIAHVTLRHGLEAIQQGNLVEAFRYLAMGTAQATLSEQDMQKLTGLFDSSVQDVVRTLVLNGYSRDAELAADRLGRELLAGAGYDPQGLARTLDRMGDDGGHGGMFATHPAPADRRAALGSPVAWAGDAGAFAQRTARYEAALGR